MRTRHVCKRGRSARHEVSEHRPRLRGMTSESQPPSLYDWAGGRTAIARMIDAFYDRVEKDDLIGPLFPGGVSRAHRDHVTTWWAEVFGAPQGPGDHERPAVPFCIADESRGRRRRAARRPGVSRGTGRLPRMGNAPGHGELATRRRGRSARTRPAVGMGRRTALSTVTGALSRAATTPRSGRRPDRAGGR
jgi:hypothetical protein